MDERLDYTSEEKLRRVSSSWDLNRAGDSHDTLTRDPSKMYLQYKNYHLHLVQQIENTSLRRTIPSTKAERYSFYRTSGTSVKCRILSLSAIDFNTMFWTYIFNSFFKSLPHTYTHLVLAKYAPEQHLFLSKMVPFFYGSKIAFITTSISQILFYFTTTLYIFAYLLKGIASQNPWNRCDTKNFTVETGDLVNCLELPLFSEKIKNITWVFNNSFFETASGEKIQLAQVVYFRSFILDFMGTRQMKCLYFLIMWSGLLLTYRAVYRRWFWKIQHRLQLTMIVMEILLCLYLMYSKFYEVHIPEHHNDINDQLSEILNRADMDFVAESVTAPPVVHLLTARSTQDILPSQDSFLISLSNAIMYIFRAVLMNRLRNHCKNIAGAPLQIAIVNPFSWFYFWPTFFSQFILGEVYTLAFLLLHFLVNFSALIITYFSFVEVTICEWPNIKQWLVNVLTLTICITLYVFYNYMTAMGFYICTTGFTTFIEIFVIYYLYPEGRLIDDVIFDSGAPPTMMKQLMWRVMPFYYGYKLYTLVKNTAKLGSKQRYIEIEEWVIVLVPYLAGMVYIVYNYIIQNKRSWQRLFIPHTDWGPSDSQKRQLRKEFDSRTYINSQAVRQLSRYMIDKRESKAFQLNLNYEPSRRSTVTTTQFRMDADKKES